MVRPPDRARSRRPGRADQRAHRGPVAGTPGCQSPPVPRPMGQPTGAHAAEWAPHPVAATPRPVRATSSPRSRGTRWSRPGRGVRRGHRPPARRPHARRTARGCVGVPRSLVVAADNKVQDGADPARPGARIRAVPPRYGGRRPGPPRRRSDGPRRTATAMPSKRTTRPSDRRVYPAIAEAVGRPTAAMRERVMQVGTAALGSDPSGAAALSTGALTGRPYRRPVPAFPGRSTDQQAG